ncbi:MAG: hypothetical protein ABI607_10815 [Betaproteobacteria bacterium]
MQAAVAPPPLLQFVFLSMLLHLLLVVMFGTSTQGGARRGDGLLGSLDVTLRNLASEQGSGFTLAPGAESNIPGAALLRRQEGSPPSPVAPTPSVRHDAASPIAPSAPPGFAAPEPAIMAAPSAAPAGESAPDISLSVRPPPSESLPKLDLNAPAEVDKPIAVPSASSPVAPPPVNTPPVATPPRERIPPPTPPLERIAPAKIEPQLVPPIELRPREAPVAPAKEEHEPAAPEEVRPRDLPLPLAAPLERIATPQIERQLQPQFAPQLAPSITPPTTPPVELPAPRKSPAEVAPPVRDAPRIEREAAPASQPLPRSDAVEAAPAKERATPTVVAPGKTPAPPARSDTAPAGELPRLRLGAPNVDDEVFRSRRDGPATGTDASPALPGITGEAMRKRVREIASEGSGTRGVLNLVPPPPERKDKLAEDIAKAAKPDCRTAYAGLGLLAVVPLVASSVGNGGCNW